MTAQAASAAASTLTAREVLEQRACGGRGCSCAGALRRGAGNTHCPAHNDSGPSLSVKQEGDRLLMHCFGGCELAAVRAALGGGTAFAPHAAPVRAKRQPRAQHGDRGEFVASYDYTDEAGRPLFTKERYALPNGKKTFLLKRPDGRYGRAGLRVVPYRLHELVNAPAGAIVFVAGGEKGANALREHGELATCNPDGDGSWQPEFAEHFRDKTVIVLPDADQSGRDLARRIARDTAGIARRVYVVDLPDLADHGDVYDFLARGGTVMAIMRLALSSGLTTTASPDPERPEHCAQIARDLAAAEARLRTSPWRALVDDIERLIASPLVAQKVKLLYIALLIALHTNPRFAGADRHHVNICEDQIAELLGGVDRGTVAAGLLILEAENLGDVGRTPTTRTVADGRTVPYDKLSLRIGPREGEEALDLHTYAKLMRNPQDAEKGALRRERKKRTPRVCPIDPTDTLQVVTSCVKHPDVIIDWDYVLPDVSGQQPAKVSPPPTYGTGELSAIDILGPRDRPGFGAQSEQPAKVSQVAVCTCGNALAPGEACGRCDLSACGECGALVVGTLSRFCRGYCAGRAATVERYAGAPPEMAAAYAGGD